MGRAFQNRKESMAKTADAKTKVYSKYGREIYVCAKAGGTDPNGNLALRGLMERAKKDQVPSHVIDKALDKASGAGGEDFSAARYRQPQPHLWRRAWLLYQNQEQNRHAWQREPHV